jgi:hypothetical protein
MECPAVPTHTIQINLRIPPELRDQVQAAAGQRGVSMNKEITDRLKRSLERSSHRAWHSQATEELLELIGDAMNSAGSSALFSLTHSWDLARQQDWIGSAYAYGRAVEAATKLLDKLKPDQEKAPPAHTETPWDADFWAEFGLKQARSGKGNVREADARAQELHKAYRNIVASRGSRLPATTATPTRKGKSK